MLLTVGINNFYICSNKCTYVYIFSQLIKLVHAYLYYYSILCVSWNKGVYFVGHTFYLPTLLVILKIFGLNASSLWNMMI